MIDILVFGAHPDDAELFAGGLLAKSLDQGRSVAVAHLTRGEMGTRGSVEERRAEALDAARALGLNETDVHFLNTGDTLIDNTPENRLQVIRLLRELRPRIVVHHHAYDRHPDHRKASRLVADASFYAGLARIETGTERFRPEERIVFHNNSAPNEKPTFILDVSEVFERKIEAVRAYRSQFHNPDYDGDDTYICSPEFFEHITTRARWFGHQIGVQYGEPFQTVGPLAVRDLAGLLDAP